MALKDDDVKELDQSEDFSKVQENGVDWVTGDNQEVRWRGSTITVFEEDNGKTISTVIKRSEGSLKVAPSMNLYIVGGKFKVV
ncbi:uncharacterized protein EKO05_0010020 [Ascochyta rabiei]|uniref:uncharacterized protein n=1 Tax=Didymella rabiei TaxID=5454 RepID=UPI001902435A|nr:uncharacterized protein EKO05_0010020 [Ascochyta rabiei]UPX19769.1 hypothetical protein EKO05_0010020 [Ascochyta rabiei]